jgi:hypothetical protein
VAMICKKGFVELWLEEELQLKKLSLSENCCCLHRRKKDAPANVTTLLSREESFTLENFPAPSLKCQNEDGLQ